MDNSHDSERGKLTKRNGLGIAAVTVTASGLVLVAIGFLTPQTIDSSNGQVMAYTTLNMLLALGGGLLFATGAYALIGKGEERRSAETSLHDAQAETMPEVTTVLATDVQAGSSLSLEEEPEGGADSTLAVAPEPGMDEMPEGRPLGKEIEVKQNAHLVLRLLSGDDRTVFRTIMEAGGEIYQKDIVNMTKMSDAKVSRTLDRLEEKGVIVKERHGMSNKVRIEVER